MQKVVVAGGTGYLGGYVIRELKHRGYWVRALVRDAGRLGAARDFVDEVYEGQVTDPATLAGLCDGADAIFSSIGITTQRDGLRYRDVDYQGNKNLLDAALAAEVGRFGYAHALNADALMALAMIRAKQAFVDTLKATPVASTVVRPSGYFSDMRAFLAMARRGLAVLPGDGHWRINPIHGADLAEVCVDAMERGETDLSVGGPEVTTYEAITRLAFEVAGKRPRILHIPKGLVRGATRLLRGFAPESVAGAAEFVSWVLTTDMVGEPHGSRRLADFFAEELRTGAPQARSG